MKSSTKDLDQALYAAQGTVEPVYRTKSAKNPNDDVWDYAVFEDVQASANKAFREHGLCLTTDSSVTIDARLKTTFRLTHIPSGQYRLITLDWPRHAAETFADVPLACKATLTHGWRTVALDLLQIPVLPRRSSVTEEKKVGATSPATRPGAPTASGAAPKAERDAAWFDDSGEWMSMEEALRVLPLLVEEYGQNTGIPATHVQIWNESFPNERVDGLLLNSKDKSRRLAMHLTKVLRSNECH